MLNISWYYYSHIITWSRRDLILKSSVGERKSIALKKKYIVDTYSNKLKHWMAWPPWFQKSMWSGYSHYNSELTDNRIMDSRKQTVAVNILVITCSKCNMRQMLSTWVTRTKSIIFTRLQVERVLAFALPMGRYYLEAYNCVDPWYYPNIKTTIAVR